MSCLFIQGLTQVEEMLMISIYRLPHGQYGYSRHIINVPQDASGFVHSLPRHPSELDIILVNQSHHDFRV